MGAGSSKEEEDSYSGKIDPRDQRRAPTNIKTEYILKVRCLECERRRNPRPCPILLDLNGNLLGERRHAYRDPANTGPVSTPSP
jgi:hypothetical protein